MSAAKQLPKELPQHVADGEEWKAWPRKVEAHLHYGVRERQVTAFCRSQRFTVWTCPDGSLRLDPEELKAEFGEPGVFTGRNRQPANKLEREHRSRELSTIDEADPLPGLVRELVLMLKETREEKTAILKLVTDPMNHAIGLLQKLTDAALKRASELEQKRDDVAVLREELNSAAHIRDIELNREQQKEKRRTETLELLKTKLPALLDKFFGTSDLASFVKSLNPEVVKSVLEIPGLLNDEQAAILRKAAGMVEPPLNGKGQAMHTPEEAGLS